MMQAAPAASPVLEGKPCGVAPGPRASAPLQQVRRRGLGGSHPQAGPGLVAQQVCHGIRICVPDQG